MERGGLLNHPGFGGDLLTSNGFLCLFELGDAGR